MFLFSDFLVKCLKVSSPAIFVFAYVDDNECTFVARAHVEQTAITTFPCCARS